MFVLCYSCFVGTIPSKICIPVNFPAVILRLFLIKFSATLVFQLLLDMLNVRSQLNYIYECHFIMKVYDTIGSSKVDEDSFPRYFIVYVLYLAVSST